jgi:hypothetical protein
MLQNLVLRPTLKSSVDRDHCWLKNHWQKQHPCGPKNIKEPSSTADADIYNTYRLMLTEKTLTKTESLLSQKWFSKPSFKPDAEIFNVHRLPLAHKPLTKPRSLGPKNNPRSPVLRLTLTSSVHIDYCWLRNRWWKLNPCSPKNHPRNPLLRLTLKFLKHIDYCWLRNRWWKLGPCGPKNHPRCPVLRPTLTSSAHIDYWWLRKHWWKWALSVPKIILETQFHGWRWNL